MGKPTKLKTHPSPKRPVFRKLPSGVIRTRPRAYAEWKALRRWRKIPTWEKTPPGYVLRSAREEAGLTQSDLARRLGCSQQAIAQAERPAANPTIEFARLWADACGARLSLEISVAKHPMEPRRARRGGV